MPMRMFKQGMIAAAGVMLIGAPASAQYAPVDPMPTGQATTSVMANKLSGDIADGKASSRSVSSRCFANSGPGAERRAMEAEYARRSRTDGKSSADAWVDEQGRQYRAKLVAAGKCKP